MIEVFALGFAAGALSCLLIHPVVWPAPTERRRDARGRYVKERPLTATERDRAWSYWSNPDPRP